MPPLRNAVDRGTLTLASAGSCFRRAWGHLKNAAVWAMHPSKPPGAVQLVVNTVESSPPVGGFRARLGVRNPWCVTCYAHLHTYTRAWEEGALRGGLARMGSAKCDRRRGTLLRATVDADPGVLLVAATRCRRPRTQNSAAVCAPPSVP